MVKLTFEKIENGDCIPPESNHLAGATVVFLGTAREFTDGKATRELEYDAYPEMAQRVMGQIEREAASRWPILECDLTHRLGRVPLGETCVVIRVSSGHRHEAFAAAVWIMDEIKKRVPIWKCEHWADGSREWVHPQEAKSEGRSA